MKMIVQLFGKNLKKVPDILRKIADEIENGKTDSSCLDDEYCYDYLIEEESYYRKFLVYSNDEIIGLDGKSRKESKILGIAFGSCPHDAFENFYVKDKKLKNVVVREILGSPAYKNLKEEKIKKI